MAYKKKAVKAVKPAKKESKVYVPETESTGIVLNRPDTKGDNLNKEHPSLKI